MRKAESLTASEACGEAAMLVSNPDKDCKRDTTSFALTPPTVVPLCVAEGCAEGAGDGRAGEAARYDSRRGEETAGACAAAVEAACSSEMLSSNDVSAVTKDAMLLSVLDGVIAGLRGRTSNEPEAGVVVNQEGGRDGAGLLVCGRSLRRAV